MAYTSYEPTPKPKAEAPARTLILVDTCSGVDAAIGKIAERGRGASDLLFFEQIQGNSRGANYNAAVTGASDSRSGWQGSGEEIKPTWSGAKRPQEGDDILYWDIPSGHWVRLNSLTREWLRARKQEDDPYSPANGGFYWTLYGAGGTVANPPTDTKDFRTRLQAAFRNECSKAGWCSSATSYLTRAGITSESKVRITLEATDNRDSRGIESRIRAGYGFSNPSNIKIESVDEDHPFDKNDLTTAIAKVHVQARQAIRDYPNTKAAITRMLRAAGAPLPGPHQATITLTVSGRTELSTDEVVQQVTDSLSRQFTGLKVSKVESEAKSDG